MKTIIKKINERKKQREKTRQGLSHHSTLLLRLDIGGVKYLEGLQRKKRKKRKKRRRCEVKRKEIETILNEKVDWVDVHTRMVLCDYETQICIKKDGSVVELSFYASLSVEGWQETIGVLRADGIKNINLDEYLEGWNWVEHPHIERLTQKKAIRTCILTNEWPNKIEEWKKIILGAWEEGQARRERFQKH